MRCLLVLAAMLLFSCKKEKISMRMPESHKVEKCDTDFNVFFEKFSADSVFQKQHTKFPLKDVSWSESYPDPETDVRYLESKDCYYYDFRKDKEAYKKETDAYNVVTEKRNDTICYKWDGVDNGISMEFKFVMIDNCWYMVEMVDMSN
ncbi:MULTISPECIES: DUF4348 domain-containing protein [Flavobacterium]|uniref:DUF4348 domain-containing protein n=1 Tax=Flavobacterium suzhouense TaxID=1529638 RepID=A0ABW5NP56_9FLAO|nr:DUF4348 domain-containing protein [Flavobacterium sp. AG291]RDI11867.1 uncharacterized protein DUF4348 [Flavobacterium sp. AG291]